MNHFTYHIFTELNEPNKSGERKIKFRVRLTVRKGSETEKTSFVVPTKVKVLDLHWDKNHKKIRGGSGGDPLAKPKNFSLQEVYNNLENTLLLVSNRHASEEDFDPIHYLKAQTDYLGLRELVVPSEPEEITLDAAARSWLEAASNDPGVKQVYNHRAVLKDLEAFQQHLNRRLLLREVGAEIIKAWINYLVTETALLNPTIESKYIYLRALLRYGERQGWVVDPSFRDYRYHPRSAQQDIALTKTELRTIMDLDLKDCPRLDKIRDKFVILCLTGLRYRDIYSISRERVKSDARGQLYLEIQMQKTARPVQIPLVSEAEAILKKYDYRLESLSNFNFNKGLKELGQRAGLTEPEKQGQYKGTAYLETVCPRYELLTAHVGRRTWATLMYEQTRDFELIRSILGHTNIEQTRKYLRLTTTEVPTHVLTAWKNILG